MNLIETKTHEWNKARDLKCHGVVQDKYSDPWIEENIKITHKKDQNIAGTLWCIFGTLATIALIIYCAFAGVSQLLG